MPSAKVLLRTSKVLKNGEHPIVLRIIKDRKAKFVFTGLSCTKQFWDFNKNKPSSKHPNKFELDLFISNKITEAQAIILNLENGKKEYSSEQIKTKYKSSSKRITVFRFMDEVIADLMKTDSIGNARIYKDCKRALSKFRNGADLNFNEIDASFLKRFERTYLERGVTGNSISVYMRTIRSVFNRAIAEDYCKSDIYPFKVYKISKLFSETSKRALTKDQVQKIIKLKLKTGSKLIHAKNVFLFSFYCRGINFKDIALLKWSAIKENRLNYTRAKTGKVYSIGLLEPPSNYQKTVSFSEDLIF